MQCRRKRLSSIDRNCVALIERHRVWAGLELHGLTPDQRLVIEASGDIEVVSSRGHAGKGPGAVGIGPDG